MIRVLVVDDDFRVAQLHASYVGSVPGFEVVGAARSAAEALELAERLAPDLVLLDEYLPDAAGSSIMGRLDAAVIVVSAAEDSGAVRRALARGAVNYVLKPFPPAVLVDRLHAFGRFWRSLDADVHLDQTAVDHALQALARSGLPDRDGPQGPLAGHRGRDQRGAAGRPRTRSPLPRWRTAPVCRAPPRSATSRTSPATVACS